MGWVGTVMAAAESTGLDADYLLKVAGIETDALQWQRWQVDYITRLWHAAEQLTQDSGFGLKVGQQVTPASLNVVGLTLQAASTLREVVTLVQQYQPLISDGGRFQLLTGSKSTWIVYHPRQGRLAFSPHQIEAVLAAVVHLAGWLTGQVLKPIKAQFSQAQLGGMQGYRQAFRCPVEFEQAFSGLLVDNAVMDRPLPQADEALSRLQRQHVEARLAALTDDVSAETIGKWISANLGSDAPRRRRAAAAFGISERTLSRRLHDEGTSFRQLLDVARHHQAVQELAGTTRSMADIAHGLGFTEVSTFYRTFKRWEGLPPQRWRQQITKAE